MFKASEYSCERSCEFGEQACARVCEARKDYLRLKLVFGKCCDVNEPDPWIFFPELSASLTSGAVSSSVSCSAGRLPFEVPSRGG